MKMYVVYGIEQGEIKECRTLEEAKKLIRELKKQDKEENINDTYTIEIEYQLPPRVEMRLSKEMEEKIHGNDKYTR